MNGVQVQICGQVGWRASLAASALVPVSDDHGGTGNPVDVTAEQVAASLEFLFSSPNRVFTRSIGVTESGEMFDNIVSNGSYSSSVNVNIIKAFFLSPNGEYLRVVTTQNDGTRIDDVIPAPAGIDRSIESPIVSALIRKAMSGGQYYFFMGVDNNGQRIDEVRDYPPLV